MQTNLIQYVIWFTYTSVKKLGLWGMIALVALGLSITFLIFSINDMDAKTNTAMAAYQAAKHKESNQIAIETPQSIDNKINAFYARFPEKQNIPTVLSTLNRHAKQQQLSLDSGSYKLTKIKPKADFNQHALTQYEIAFPLTGGYQQVRTFIANALYESPELALTQLNLHRDSTQVSSVDAEIVFVLFVKGEPW